MDKELNIVGKLLKNRIRHRRELIIKNRNVEQWGRCLELEGEICALETIWEELMGLGVLTGYLPHPTKSALVVDENEGKSKAR